MLIQQYSKPLFRSAFPPVLLIFQPLARSRLVPCFRRVWYGRLAKKLEAIYEFDISTLQEEQTLGVIMELSTGSVFKFNFFKSYIVVHLSRAGTLFHSAQHSLDQLFHHAGLITHVQIKQGDREGKAG